VRRDKRYWVSLLWSSWIVVLIVITATVCAGHSAAHHDVHPPLCLESSSPAAHRDDRLVLFADGGTFPLPPTSLVLVASPAPMSTPLPLNLPSLPYSLSGTHDSLSVISPRAFLPVLRL
jgi:hypothetical protein